MEKERGFAGVAARTSIYSRFLGKHDYSPSWWKIVWCIFLFYFFKTLFLFQVFNYLKYSNTLFGVFEWGFGYDIETLQSYHMFTPQIQGEVRAERCTPGVRANPRTSCLHSSNPYPRCYRGNWSAFGRAKSRYLVRIWLSLGSSKDL